MEHQTAARTREVSEVNIVIVATASSRISALGGFA
jgi:hypothetical protein